MPVRKAKRRAPQKKFATKFKQAPIKTLKSSWRSMGTVGKIATVSVAAGMAGGQAAQAVNSTPVLGRFLRIGTSFGANIRRRLRI
jgi:hypothetical protein